MARPPRIDGIPYTGRETYLVTIVTLGRVKAFNDMDFGRLAQQLILQHAAKNRFAVPAYVFMPDHVHYVATGLSADADLRHFNTGWKQATGFWWSRRGFGKLWQPGFWERRARFDEPVEDMVRYVVENPVRGRLVDTPSQYPLIGSSEMTTDALMALCCGIRQHRQH